jgi:hypothetical protein
MEGSILGQMVCYTMFGLSTTICTTFIYPYYFLLGLEKGGLGTNWARIEHGLGTAWARVGLGTDCTRSRAGLSTNCARSWAGLNTDCGRSWQDWARAQSRARLGTNWARTEHEHGQAWHGWIMSERHRYPLVLYENVNWQQISVQICPLVS